MRTQKIGVFVSHIFGEYQHGFCQGVIEKASEFGFHVDIFCTTDGENLGEYGLGEKTILRIPNLSEYAGILFVSGTYLLDELREKLREQLSSQCRCPVVEIAQKPDLFPTVILDNFSSVQDLVDHLIKVHHYTRIAYLGNLQEDGFSKKREKHFREALSSHNIPIRENYMAEATYEDASIAEALKHFMNADERPQAIVCYNDRVALTAMMLLQQMGYRIPQDIALTGFDCSDMGQANTPSLTTVTFPVQEIGSTAVTELIARIDGKSSASSVVVHAGISIGASCGCHGTSLPHLTYEQQLVKRIEHTEKALLQNINMASILHGVTDIDEGMDILASFVRELSGCREFYLCLYGDWNRLSHHIQQLTLAEDEDIDQDTVLLKFGMRDGVRLPECTFFKHSPLPEYIYCNTSNVYVYSPLYFGEKAFGYVVISYADNIIEYPFIFFPWLMNINSMLKSICDKRSTSLLISRLEDIYTKDDLTGLYNRQGFKLISEQFLTEAERLKKSLFVAVFDLDGLKNINDTYGHLEGNFAIQVLGHALDNSVQEGDICARLGGDEFYVLGAGYTDDTAGLFMNHVQKYLENYNRLNTKSYKISASGGYYITSKFVLSDLQELFDKADHLMYETKKRKKKTSLNQDIHTM